MTLALWCVLIAALLPYVATGIAKFATRDRYDNRDPRAFLDRQTGIARRADNAQKNGFEAFPFFAAAVIVAEILNAPQDRLDILAAQDTDYSLLDKKKKGGFGAKETQHDEVTKNTYIGSEITTGGNLTLASGGDQHYQVAKLDSTTGSCIKKTRK